MTAGPLWEISCMPMEIDIMPVWKLFLKMMLGDDASHLQYIVHV